MTPDRYWFKVPNGDGHVVRIEPNSRDASRWALWFDEKLICDDSDSPEHAAFRANRKDFSPDEANETNRLFSGIWVPADLHQWRTSPPDKSPAEILDTPPRACQNRSVEGAPVYKTAVTDNLHYHDRSNCR